MLLSVSQSSSPFEKATIESLKSVLIKEIHFFPKERTLKKMKKTKKIGAAMRKGYP